MKSIEFRYRHLRITFIDGLVEYWVIRRGKLPTVGRAFLLPRHGPHFCRPIPTYKEYETNPLEIERYKMLQPFFIIQYRDVLKAGWCDIRVKIHELVNDLSKEGWINVKYPPEILNADLASVKAYNPKLSDISGARFMRHGFHLISQFMPLHKYTIVGPYNEFNLIKWWKQTLLLKAIEWLINHQRDISRTTLYKRIIGNLRLRYTRMPGLPFYRAIHKFYYPVAGKTILDITPGWGIRALATTIDGGQYYYDKNYILYKGLHDLTKFVGKEAIPDDGNRHYDTIILNDVQSTDFEHLIVKIDRFKSRATDLIMIIEKQDLKLVVNKYCLKLTVDLQARNKYFLVI